jgi:hypothetical protein
MENLLKVYSKSTNYERQLGKEAYQNYHILTTGIAKEFGFPFYVGPAVFSALSPNSDYLGNLRDVRVLLKAKAEGRSLSDFSVHTYGNNKRKAWEIANCSINPLNLIVANKTRNFYLNCLCPEARKPITIDGHIYNAARGIRENLVGLRGFTPKKYEEIAQSMRNLAKDLSLIPNQLQAIIWMTWKRLHHAVHSDQLEIWPPDNQIAHGIYK